MPSASDEATSPPLSSAQRRFWWLHQIEPEGSSYNTYLVVEVSGALDVAALERCFDAIVRRHSVLRTTFASPAGIPIPTLNGAVTFGWTVADLEALPAGERRAALDRRVEATVRQPFDLAHGPLLRVGVWRLGASTHILALVMHHIIADRWSMGILMRELAEHYGAFANGAPVTLPPLERQYVDYARAEHAVLESAAGDAHAAYWRAQFGGELTPLALRVDRPARRQRAFGGASVSDIVQPAAADAMIALARGHNATPFMAFLAAFVTLLHRYSGSVDVVVGVPVSGRREQYTQTLIGCFIDTLPLRCDVSADPPFRTLLERVRRTCLEGFSHQELPFERIVELVNPDRSDARPPLFRVMFTLNDIHDPLSAYPTLNRTLDASGLRLRTVDVDQAVVPCDLILHVERHGDGITTRLAYDAGLFEAATARRLLAAFRVLVSHLASRPDAPLSRVALLDEPAREQRIAESRGPSSPYPRQPLGDLITTVAARAPAHVALVSEDGDGRLRELTYGELDRHSTQVARALVARGIRPGQVVGLLGERSARLIVATLGVLKAGAAYLPLDPDAPGARRTYMLESAPAALLLSDRDVPDAPVPVIRFDRDADVFAESAGACSSAARTIDQLAYVCYTSGSTGRPKGVGVTHRGILRLVFGQPGLTLGPEQCLLHLASFAFDASTFEIWGALLHGARLVLSPERVPSAATLQRLITRHGITTMFLTSSLFNATVDDDPRALAGLRQLVTGGEALSVPHVRAARRACPDLRLTNAYGPTEDAVMSCLQDMPSAIPEGWSSIPIGRPVANGTAFVLDRALQPAPIGVEGELYVGGHGLARGYVGAPGLTADRFVPDPFAPVGHGGGRLYRTGDLAAVRNDGAIEFLGRRDAQMKIRGFRVEPGEIESALLAHPNVRECVVLLQKDDAGRARLVACVAPRTMPGPTLEEIGQFLGSALPEYMLPRGLVTLEELPRLASDKIDRQRLAREATIEQLTERESEPPQGELEEAVADIWRSLLGVERIGRADSFFLHGGHSILATQLAVRIERRFQSSIPLRTLMEQPTIEAMARHVAAHRDTPATPEASWQALAHDPAARHDPFPLTDIQQAYWIGRSTELPLGGVSSHGYQEIDVLDLDLPRLEQAVQQLVQRHDMLRAVIDADGRQRVLAAVPAFRIELLDVRALDEEARAEAAMAVRAAMSHEVRPCDVWPLFDLRASRLDERRTRLHVSTDALIGDAWSWSILGRELTQLYRDPDAALEPLDIGFRDYVLALQAMKTTRAYAQSEAYWRGRLAELPPAPPLGLTDGRRASTVPPRFTRRTGRLAQDEWRRLEAASARAGISPTALLLAAFNEVIATWSGAQRFTITLTLFNRLPFHPQVGRLVGDFTSLTLLAVDRQAEPFTARARRLQRDLWESLDHRYFSGVQVLRELRRREPDEGGAALPVVFTSTLSQNLGGGTPMGEVVYGITQTPQVSLDHQVYEKEGGLAFNWDAVEDLFPAGYLDAMWSAYGALLQRLAADDAAWQQVAGLIPDPDAARRAAFNRTGAPFVPATLHGLIAPQFAARPQQTAIVSAARSLTYRQLDRESARLAARLRAAGATPNTLVAVVMEKGWEQVVGVLGVLRAGAAYLPLDPRLPTARLWHLLAHGEVRCVVTQPAVDDAVSWPDGLTRLRVDAADDGENGESPVHEESAASTPADLAYVIYTSGSTGTPKGVTLDHQSVANTIVDINERFAMTPHDRVLALSSLSFDLSVFDIFGTLAAGATIVMPSAGQAEPAHWTSLIAAHGVTVWNSVPALMELLIEYGDQPAAAPSPSPSPSRALPRSLRVVMLSGDWIPLSLVPKVRATWPDAAFASLGGATEAAIWSIWHPIDTLESSWRSVPYGRPLKNQTIHVLNPMLEPCPAGVAGQICIGGVGLALGYWRDEEKTRASFIVHPESGERLYCTGDLGRHLPDMSVEFLGRVDHQVKIRGHRIELGEIEAALLQHPGVRAAVVTASGSGAAGRRLFAYVVPAAAAAPAGEAASAPEAGELRAFLDARLPHYMVPSAFVSLDRLPLTANGKVDRASLPAPEAAPAATAATVTAAPALVARVAAVVAGVLDVSSVDSAADLLVLGANSVDIIRIVNALETAYGVRLTLEEVYQRPTPASLASGIEQRMAGAGGHRADSATEKAAQALARLKRLSPEERQALLHSTGAGS